MKVWQILVTLFYNKNNSFIRLQHQSIDALHPELGIARAIVSVI